MENADVVNVVTRAAPKSEERTIRLRRSTIPISTEDDYDTTCDLFTWTWDSLGEIMALGMDFLVHRSKGNRRWDVGFAVAAKIVPVHGTSPGSNTVPTLQKLKGTRLWRQIGYWRSRDRADGPARDVVKDMDKAAEECSEKLVKEIRDQGRSPFPDDEFIERIAVLLREEDAPGRPLPEIPGFGEFCSRILQTAASDPEAAARDISYAQRSKNADRKRMPRQFMTVMQDEILRAYCQGMELALAELQNEGFCKDRYSLGFFRFFHRQKPYLDGLVPDLHPIRALLLKSKRFIDAAVRRFDNDASQGLRSLVLADFFGTIEAAAHICRYGALRERTVDLEKKKRRGTISSAGSDLERLIHDNGMKVPAPPVARRKRKAKKASGTKRPKKPEKAKKVTKAKKTTKVKKAKRNKRRRKGQS